MTDMRDYVDKAKAWDMMAERSAKQRTLEAKLDRAIGALTRARTVLGNMALEREGAIFRRWPISHEPLRADARGLLPVIDEVLAEAEGARCAAASAL